MHLDLYRRNEPEGKLSFLAVPAGRPIPPEAASCEWLVHASAQPLDEDAPAFTEYGIARPGEQLRDKGYAITDLAHQLQASAALGL